MRKKRLYILGDSFAANLFKKPWLKEGTEIYRFKEDFENKFKTKLLWWTDYIEMWSDYEIHNFGYGGCSMEDIILQFSQIDDYVEGDRLIVHLTSPMRFKLYHDAKTVTVNPDYLEYVKLSDDKIEFLLDILDTRKITWYEEDGNKQRDFLNYLYKMHHQFKPIFCSIFPENIITMKNLNYFTNIAELLKPECLINVESESKYKDGHWGYVGNIRVALVMLSYLYYGDNFSTRDKMLICNHFPNDKGYNLDEMGIYKDYICNFHPKGLI